MFILGIGAAFPEHLLSGHDLNELGLSLRGEQHRFADRVGVSSRRVSLPLEYIKASGNIEVLEAWKVATDSPTSLGLEACKKALSQAGIGIDAVGLLLADTASPRQTCPSEAQRIAGEFGIKIPAYDVVGGISTIPHYLSMLSAWREERIPEYVLCVSTNTPSQHVRYKDDALGATLFGDAAVAIVVSKQRSSRVPVLHAHLEHERLERSPLIVERAIICAPDSVPETEELARFLTAEWRSITQRYPQVSARSRIIPPQLFAAESVEILRDLGVSAERIHSGVRDNGFSMGSAYGVALAQSFEARGRDEVCVIMHCGDGMRGSVLMGSD